MTPAKTTLTAPPLLPTAWIQSVHHRSALLLLAPLHLRIHEDTSEHPLLHPQNHSRTHTVSSPLPAPALLTAIAAIAHSNTPLSPVHHLLSEHLPKHRLCPLRDSLTPRIRLRGCSRPLALLSPLPLAALSTQSTGRLPPYHPPVLKWGRRESFSACYLPLLKSSSTRLIRGGVATTLSLLLSPRLLRPLLASLSQTPPNQYVVSLFPLNWAEHYPSPLIWVALPLPLLIAPLLPLALPSPLLSPGVLSFPWLLLSLAPRPSRDTAHAASIPFCLVCAFPGVRRAIRAVSKLCSVRLAVDLGHL
jgi:hypothetical protein